MFDAETLQMPFKFFQAELPNEQDKNLTANDRLVWFYLHKFMTENAKDEIYRSPTISEIAKETNLTSSGVYEILKLLEEVGYIETKQKRAGESVVFDKVVNPFKVLKDLQ